MVWISASFEEEIASILNSIVSAVSVLQEQFATIVLTVLCHTQNSDKNQDGIISRVLLPPFQSDLESARFTYPPQLNLPAEQFFSDLSEHYLFAALYEIAYTSLMIENLWRVQHLEGAVHRLDADTETLTKKCRTLRQEEITEEIEVILLSADSMLQPTRYKP